ncbi:MAG TPA: FtsX-like permease family protein [Longimicrobiales bacterium]|nr:FtsX-like permease family protein [Longimicrobiales bacterium]
MKRLDWFIARRYLASRRKGRFVSLITLIAVGGVFVGVAALIIVIAVMTGLQRDLQAKIIGMNPHVYVFQQGRGFRMPDWRPALETVRQAPGVVVAEPFIMTQVAVFVPGTDYAQAGMLYGVDPAPESGGLTTVQKQIASGELDFGPTSTGYPPLVMGRRLAERLSVFPGDTIQIVSLENFNTGGGGEMVPIIRPFEVTDRFSTGMYEYDSNFMYAALEPVQDLLHLEDGVGAIGVNVSDPWAVQGTAQWIQDELRFPYYTNDWVQLNSSLFSALKLEKIVMTVILFLIVVVAAFNIISTLIMVVADKTREIGILKSMGMSDHTVLRIFMLQGLAIGVVGTLLGTGLGLGLTWALDTYQFIELPGDVYFLDSLPVALDPVDVALIVLLSVGVAFAATIYPARQAAGLLPVEAIRHD